MLAVIILGGALISTGTIDITNNAAGEALRNKANLIEITDTYKDLDGKQSGVDINVNKDGSLTFDGRAEADIVLTLLTDADGFGEQCLMSLGEIDFGEDAAGAFIAVYDGVVLEAKTDGASSVFISSGTTEHTVKIFIPKGADLDNVTVYPMLNYGVTAESFYKAIQ